FVVLLLLLRFTAFPYTTLFRSYGVYEGTVYREHDGCFPLAGVNKAGLRCQYAGVYPVHIRIFVIIDAVYVKAELVVYSYECHLKDRKSTRLNSSHVSISYAVF